MLNVLSPQEIDGLLSQEKIILIDVREPNEHQAEHIAGAVLRPLSTFDAGDLPFEDGRLIVLHCGIGKRSAMAAEKCFAVGVKEITHMEGGLAAWKKAGLTTKSG